MNKKDLKDKKLSEKQRTKKSFKDVVENKLMPAFAKFGSFPLLVTIRDAFALMIPIIIAGSVAILGSAFIFGGGSSGSSLSTSIIGWIADLSNQVTKTTSSVGQTQWVLQGGFGIAADVGDHIFSVMNSATIGCLALFTSFFIAWRWASIKESRNPILAGLTGLSSFLIITEANKYFFDANGLLSAMLIAFLASQLFIMLEKSNKLRIKLPEQVPSSVSNGFSALLPILIVLLSVTSLNVAAWSIGKYVGIDITSKGEILFNAGDYGFAGLFFKLVSAPFLTFASSSKGGFGLAMFYIFFYGLFWFFGIHGGNVLNGVFYPIWFGLIATNADLILNQGISPTDSSLSIFNMAFFETYLMPTGWGLTGGIVLATTIFTKNKKFKEINKVAGPAAIFNINEPVTFGYPLMLNPVLGIAGVLCMPIFMIFAWLFVGPLGLVNKSYIYVPWTMPVGIGALLSTGMDWKALVLSLTIFALAFVYYIPFVLINEKYEKMIELKEKNTETTLKISDSTINDIFAKAKSEEKKNGNL